MSVKLIWATPEAEKHILYMARVSSENQESNDTKLLKYLINHKHWSPFEMAHMCVEIETSRAVSAQIIRHRSFSFQEFSQRYAKTTELIATEARRQDTKNRQNSIDDLSESDKTWWRCVQISNYNYTQMIYQEALDRGIAKECARMILPIAARTKLYMAGSIRSWLHYFDLRCDKATQLEHREIAEKAREIFKAEFPTIGSMTGENNNE